MGVKIDGREQAKIVKEQIKAFCQERKEKNLRVPCIATILVGEDGGSIFYVNNQNKLCSELGVKAVNYNFSEDIKEDELIEVIKRLNEDETIDGIMLQVPLPKGLDEKRVISAIAYNKDVDGLTDINIGRFYKGERSFVPCTPQSIIRLIKSTGCNIQGKHAVVIGRSNIVGKPVAQLLLNENATVTICHSKTENLKEVCLSADILVAAIGRPGFLNGEYVKKGAIVIDVGTSMVNGKITGDVLYDEVIENAAYATPVPGGVGAMTTTLLLNNCCEALRKNVY